MDDQIQTIEPPPPSPRRLIRSSESRMLLGVCGGLGDYFDVDPTIVRVVFVLGMLGFGSTVLVYIVLAFIMPSSEMVEAHPRDAARGTLNEATDEIRSGINWLRDHNPFGKKSA